MLLGLAWLGAVLAEESGEQWAYVIFIMESDVIYVPR